MALFETAQEKARFGRARQRALHREEDWSNRQRKKRLREKNKHQFKQETAGQRMARLRVAELETIFNSRWGPVLPDDDAGREDMEIALHHVAHIDPTSAIGNMIGWMNKWSPWLAKPEAEQIAKKIARCPKKFRQDHLAQLLNLNMEARKELKIRTIGATDATREERAEIAKRNQVERKKAKRRARGVRPRDEYEGQSLSKKVPWKAEGVCRRTWERRRSKARLH